MQSKTQMMIKKMEESGDRMQEVMQSNVDNFLKNDPRLQQAKQAFNKYRQVGRHDG